MKSLTKFNGSALQNQIVDAVQIALSAVESATQKCLVAGQLMNEFKTSIDHGAWLEWRAKHLPGISDETAQRWMRAAANVTKALPPVPDSIDVEAISISQILSLPDSELTESAREWKQSYFDFTADKTLKECLSAVCVEGDEGHRVDRAINGKTKGGTRGEDRKDWPKYIERHVSDVTGLLGCNEKNREKRWADMTALQRQTIQDSFATALTKWPTPLLEYVAKQSREQLKTR